MDAKSIITHPAYPVTLTEKGFREIKGLAWSGFAWDWNGEQATLMSRATDETGQTQPTYAELKNVRGPGTSYHYNHIQAWTVRQDGSIVFGENA